jgi:hypothetical protein
MGIIIRPPVEEARRLFEGKVLTSERDVAISFIHHGYCTRRGIIHIDDPLPPTHMPCYKCR